MLVTIQAPEKNYFNMSSKLCLKSIKIKFTHLFLKALFSFFDDRFLLIPLFTLKPTHMYKL